MLEDADLRFIFDGLTSKEVSAKSAAVSRVYKLFSPTVYKKLRYRFRSVSESDAQDIVQDAFLKLYTTNSLPKSYETLPAWIFRFAENTALDLFKRAYIANELSWPDFDWDDINESSESYHEPDISDEEIRLRPLVNSKGVIMGIDEDVNRDAERCFGEKLAAFGLKYPQREATLSMVLDGKPTEEIALSLGRSLNATWVYIHECKKKLVPFIEQCREMLK